MGLFDSLSKRNTESPLRGLVDYGKQKKDGSHDHRYNRGDDRTPTQKTGDKKSGKTGTA